MIKSFFLLIFLFLLFLDFFVYINLAVIASATTVNDDSHLVFDIAGHIFEDEHHHHNKKIFKDQVQDQHHVYSYQQYHYQQQGSKSKRTAISIPERLWPYGVIPYRFNIDHYDGKLVVFCMCLLLLFVKNNLYIFIIT